VKTILYTLAASVSLAFQLGGAVEQAATPSPTDAPSNDVAVKGLPEDKPIVEPHLAAHPRDPNHLVAGAIIADAATPFSATQVCASLATFDGGRTWSTHVFDIQGCGDPWVAVGTEGDAWFTGLGRRATAAGQRLWLFRSVDGGRTWLDPIDFGTGHDHQTLIVGSPETASENVLYLVSGLGRNTPSARFHAFVARSDDRGKTWREPLVLTPSNLNFNAFAGGLLPDGSVLLPFVDFQKPPFSSSGHAGAAARVDLSDPEDVRGVAAVVRVGGVRRRTRPGVPQSDNGSWIDTRRARLHRRVRQACPRTDVGRRDRVDRERGGGGHCDRPSTRPIHCREPAGRGRRHMDGFAWRARRMCPASGGALTGRRSHVFCVAPAVDGTVLFAE
jgi:hypothetical protein